MTPNICAIFRYPRAFSILSLLTSHSIRDEKYTLESDIGNVTQQHMSEINEMMMDSPRNGSTVSIVFLEVVGSSGSCSILEK